MKRARSSDPFVAARAGALYLISALTPLLASASPVAGCTAVPPTRAAPTTTSRALSAALDGVDEGSIKSDIAFIACDEMGGRDTPSRGLAIAARYLRARLERLDWQPGAGEDYLYRYDLERSRLDETASAVVVERDGARETLRFGRDYFYASRSVVGDLRVEGRAVFCGTGEQEELDQAQLEGRWAFCFDAGEKSGRVVSRVRKAGAIGLLLAPGPTYTGEPYPLRFGETTELTREGRVRYPAKEGESGRSRSGELFPTLMIERGVAVRLLQSEGTPAMGADLGISVTDTRKVEAGGRVTVENVCGLWPGSDPKLAQEVILLSAHYDHVGTRDGEVYNGADDNGSGTCALLAVAEALARYGPLRRSVMLIWVSGEEKGLWGSHAWSEKPSLREGMRAITNLNIDMIGRNGADKLLITPTRERREYNGLVRLTEALAPLEGFPELGSADDFYSRSDHVNFAKLGIPVAFLFAGVHEDYHQPGDDAEKVDADKVRRVARLCVRVLDGLQADVLDL